MRKKEPLVQVQTFTVVRRIVQEEKTCPQCGTVFLGRKNRKFCSLRCAQKNAYHRNPEAYRESRMRSYRKRKEHASKE